MFEAFNGLNDFVTTGMREGCHLTPETASAVNANRHADASPDGGCLYLEQFSNVRSGIR
jgi:hypothetical protein